MSSNMILFKKNYQIIIFLAVVSAVTCISAWASNGSYLIGVTPASQAMGGSGTALYTGDGNALFRNSALLVAGTPEKGLAEASLMKIWPGIRTKSSDQGREWSSSVGIPIIPQVSVGYRPCDKLGFGLGVFTFAGTNIDFKDATELDRLKTYSRYTRLILGAAIRPHEMVSIGVSPFIGFGGLAINSNEIPFGQSNRETSTDTAFGAQLGLALFPLEGFTVGFQYSFRQRFKFESVSDLQRFDATAGNEGSLDTFVVDLPKQANFGMGYEFSNIALKVTGDLMWIDWSGAKGTDDLEWRDQYVWALGVEKALHQWKFRAGFNYGRSVVNSRSQEDGLGLVKSQDAQILAQSRSVFSVVGFPAQATTHFTAGAGYSINDFWAADLAFVYSPKKELTRSGTTFGVPYKYITSGRQFSVALGGSYLF